MSSLKGKSIVVTGAATGIGRGTAQFIAQAGASVLVADVDVDGGQETAQMITDGGGTAHFRRTDITDEADVAALVDEAVSTYGRLDGAFNNAAILGAGAPVADADLDDWSKVLQVNLTGTWLCMKHEIRAMLATGGGAVVNAASGAGLVGLENQSPYVASKHGVIGITKTAALEYAKSNVRVNAVCPAVIRTKMVSDFIANDPAAEAAWASMQPIGRMGAPEEIGGVVAFLLSDAASLVTGSAIAVDGGLFAQAYGGHRDAS